MRWPVCFATALACLLCDLCEVGPRRACIFAKHGTEDVARTRVEVKRSRPKRMGKYLTSGLMERKKRASAGLHFVRVSRMEPAWQLESEPGVRLLGDEVSDVLVKHGLRVCAGMRCGANSGFLHCSARRYASSFGRNDSFFAGGEEGQTTTRATAGRWEFVHSHPSQKTRRMGHPIGVVS